MRYLSLVAFLPIALAYSTWFKISYTLSGGDWPYLFKENIKDFKIIPSSSFLWLEPYYHLSAKLGLYLLLPWEVSERLFWFFPFLIISILSSWIYLDLLFRNFINEHRNLFVSIGCLIFVTNTYILMVTGGGQMGVAVAYAITPFVLYYSYLISQKKIDNLRKNLLLLSIVLGLQLMFDPRIFLLTVFIGLLQILFLSYPSFNTVKHFLASAIFALIFNLFWIIPNISSYFLLYKEVSSKVYIDFFSFASFSNTFSLLHPNWPENIFGKIYFMKPEFILTPIFAFLGFLFMRKERIILFFTCLAILGSFLAKGSQEPFGQVYQIFGEIPGFMMFRDPTKFYLLISIAYSVLIPLSLSILISWLSKNHSKYKNFYILFVFIAFIFYWSFLLRPALFGKLSGTFSPTKVPTSYIQLKDFLIKQDDKFTLLWIPSQQRFGFSSSKYYALNSDDIFGSLSAEEFVNTINTPQARNRLKEESVKYLVLPYDSKRELFIDDKKYNEKKKMIYEENLDSYAWVKKKIIFGKADEKIILYQL